jgi:hypothetical protein
MILRPPGAYPGAALDQSSIAITWPLRPVAVVAAGIDAEPARTHAVAADTL